MAPRNSSPSPEVSERTRERKSSGSVQDAESICHNSRRPEGVSLKPSDDGIKYTEAILSLLILFFGFTCGSLAVRTLPKDPRMDKYPLLSSSLLVLFLAVSYILLSFIIGPWYMKDRRPFKLRTPMLVYNAFQVVFSAWMFYEIGMSGWFFEYSYGCQPCNFSNNPTAMRMTIVAWFFYFSKLIDFIDTFFFVVNKKFKHVSILHVVHHSCMYISMYFGIRYMPGGHITFMGFLNSFVHAIMYSYYLLSAMGPSVRPYLWWKKYLTKLQLIQFALIFSHAFQLFFIDCPEVPIGLPIWTCIYSFIFFALFINFYLKAYITSERKPKEVAVDETATFEAANGSLSNGHANIFVSAGGSNDALEPCEDVKEQESKEEEEKEEDSQKPLSFYSWMKSVVSSGILNELDKIVCIPVGANMGDLQNDADYSEEGEDEAEKKEV